MYMFDDMFEILDALTRDAGYTALQGGNKPLADHGLKSIVKRPHNLFTIRDANGDVVKHVLEVVYTPWSKTDVKVEIKDGELTVKCGDTNKAKDEGLVYGGISRQNWQFSFTLSDKIDVNKITAKAEDGILKIEMPMRPEAKPQTITVNVD